MLFWEREDRIFIFVELDGSGVLEALRLRAVLNGLTPGRVAFDICVCFVLRMCVDYLVDLT